MLRHLKSWIPLLAVGLFCSLRVAADVPGNGNPPQVQQSGTNNQAGSNCAQAQAASGTASSLTVSACGSGLYLYFTYMEFDLVASAATTAGMYPVTTTNLGGLQFDQSLLATAGFNAPPVIITSPIKQPTANQSVTFSAGAPTTGVLSGIRVCY